MDDGLPDILEQHLARLERGAAVDACLAADPAHAAELAEPLRAAAALRDLPRPAMSDATRSALEARMLALAASRRGAAPNTQPTPVPATPPAWRALSPAAILASVLQALGYRGPLAQPWLRLAAVAVTLVLALALGAGAIAAARALASFVQPQPSATPSALPTTPPPAPLSLDGPIEEIAQERWVVGGRAVIIGADTSISGAARRGATAHVRAAQQPAPDPGDKNHACQGQQRGRDEKKCKPKPHEDRKDDKKKDKPGKK